LVSLSSAGAHVGYCGVSYDSLPDGNSNENPVRLQEFVRFLQAKSQRETTASGLANIRILMIEDDHKAS
jgi:hypothetical protein